MSSPNNALENAAELEATALHILQNETEREHVERAIAFALVAISRRLEALEYIGE